MSDFSDDELLVAELPAVVAFEGATLNDVHNAKHLERLNFHGQVESFGLFKKGNEPWQNKRTIEVRSIRDPHYVTKINLEGDHSLLPNPGRKMLQFTNLEVDKKMGQLNAKKFSTVHVSDEDGTVDFPATELAFIDVGSVRIECALHEVVDVSERSSYVQFIAGL